MEKSWWAKLVETDPKLVATLVIALVGFGSSLIGHVKEQKTHDQSQEQYAIALSIAGTHQLALDSLRVIVARQQKQLKRLRIAHGRGSRIESMAETLIVVRPLQEQRGTLLRSLRKLWPW